MSLHSKDKSQTTTIGSENNCLQDLNRKQVPDQLDSLKLPNREVEGNTKLRHGDNYHDV